jgi:D-alanine-D-alanine ligase
MPSQPIRVALLFGGRSAEHDVSILSARSVAKAVVPERVTIVPICIARDGRFVEPERSARILAGEERRVTGDPYFSFDTWYRAASIDIVFPLIHGTNGEDGTLPGYLEILGVPYVGSGVTGSAVGMDKWHMKYAFAQAKLPMVEYVQLSESDWRREPERALRSIENALRLPYFVKPANAGSSVGVSKVKNGSELTTAIDKALRFDDKVLVERGVDAREIEVSVLGNDQPQASLPGEIVAGREFYDYEDKYIGTLSRSIIPSDLPESFRDEVRGLAVRAFDVLGGAGFARVDFFLERGTHRLLVNEINSLPGFTPISMFPKMWEATGLPLPKLLDRLVRSAFQRPARGR